MSSRTHWILIMPTEQLLIRRVANGDRPEHYATQRESKRKRDEEAALAAILALPIGWHRAVEVSAVKGDKTFHSTAFALRRLADQGILREELIRAKGKCRSWEWTRIYSVVVLHQPKVVRRVSFG